jgi:hypothetical protein
MGQSAMVMAQEENDLPLSFFILSMADDATLIARETERWQELLLREGFRVRPPPVYDEDGFDITPNDNWSGPTVQQDLDEEEDPEGWEPLTPEEWARIEALPLIPESTPEEEAAFKRLPNPMADMEYPVAAPVDDAAIRLRIQTKWQRTAHLPYTAFRPEHGCLLTVDVFTSLQDERCFRVFLT